MDVGFIGLGHMGSGMAANLIAAGHQVTVYNRTREKAEPLVQKGGRLARNVAEACGGEAVVSMLADDHAVESIVFSDAGMLATLRPGAIHISMSTIGVALSQRLADAHAGVGQRYVAAPVFGRPEAAATGKLFIVAAGEPAAVDACRPLFDAMGEATFPIGVHQPHANLVKLSGNFLIATTIECLGEAVALVAKAGIDRQRFFEILTSTLFDAPVYRTYGSLVAEEKYEPAGFAAPLGHKDIRLALAAAEHFKVPMPAASLVSDRFVELFAAGGENLDWSALAKMAARDAGL